MPQNAGEFDIVEAINSIGEEIESVLQSRDKEKYFQSIILLYSLIENVLIWSVFVKAVWEKSREQLSAEQMNRLHSFCQRLNFYTALNMALFMDLIDFGLYRRIDAIRNERNDVVHQLWLYAHRQDPFVLRKRLEKLARIASGLAKIVEQLTDEIGVDDIRKIIL